MAGYDPKKAAEYNRLIQQGVDPESAIAQAGITDTEVGNYQINSVGTPATNADYGKMSALTIGQGKVAGVDYDTAPTQTTSSYTQTTKTSYTTTSTETVSGGGSTTITSGPRIPTETSQAYAAAGDAKQAEIDQFIKDNPSNFARKRQGLPPLTPEENASRNAQLSALQDQRSQLYNQQVDAETATPGTVTTTPNTTTTTQTVTTQTLSTRSAVNFGEDQQLSQSTEIQLSKTTSRSNGTSATGSSVNPASDPSQFPAYDDNGNLMPGYAVNEETGQPYYHGVTPGTKDTGVNPASDPSQFPAYDDEGNLMPGFAVNEETGQTYYHGVAPAQQQTSGFDPNYDEFGNYDAAVEANRVQETAPANINDPYYGLTPDQIKWLGNADPTDPYIRARGGLPQLPGSTLLATAGFGTIKTGVPAIDSALGIIGKVSSLFSNFASTVGGLFGGKPTASTVASTTGMSVAGLTTPAAAPATKDTAVNPASDPSQFPAYDDEGNLMPGYAVNEETGQPYYHGNFPPTKDTGVNPASDPSQFPAYDDEGNLMPGYAINEETGQTYYHGVTPGTRDTGVNPASDPSQFPAYDDEGNLMPGYAINEETGQTYYHGVTPGTRDTGVNPASDPSQFPAYDDEGNLMPGYAINEETGQTYYHGVTPGTTNTEVAGLTDYGTTYDEFGSVVPRSVATGTDATTLSAEQADAFYNGTGTPTAAERAATDAQTAKDAAALYPGTNNTNLKNINEASGAIAQNEAGIANAKDIIAKNNEELADPNISDERRAELEANNAAQENYIRLAEDNTAENELVIEANADAFAAGGGEPNSGQGPMEVAGLTDPATENVFDPGQTFNADGESVFDPASVSGTEDPYAQFYDQGDAPVAEWYDAGELPPEEDPFAVQTEDTPGPTEADLAVDPLTDEELAVQEAYQQDNRDILAEQATDVEPGEDPFEQSRLDAEARFNEEPDALSAEDVDANQGGLELPPGAEEDGPPQEEPYALNPDEDEAIAQQEGGGEENPEPQGSEDSVLGASQAATIAKAKQQATFQARYKQQSNTDWRFRLSLSPNSKYLYNAGDPGILQPLAATDGVIFPYTPTVTTTYSANYEQYDLVHSNYRGVFYKNSRVGDISIRGTFTAQDTKEAAYLLAVIHFFRSATKMFYGQDAERGTPPPICLLNGLGQYQFSDHPVLITSFNYTLPNDVDYIRTTSANNFGPNMDNRNVPAKSNPNSGAIAGLNRLLNAIPGGLPKGALPQIPAPNSLVQNVNNTAAATYVPTKMEIDINCIPVQTRSQVSKQFSLKGFANGDLLKGGFW